MNKVKIEKVGEVVSDVLSDAEHGKFVYLPELELWVAEDGTIYRFGDVLKKVSISKANPYGYQRLRVKQIDADGNATYVTTTVQRVVAYAFKIISDISYSKDPMDVDHIDGDVHNNSISNLQALTHSENIRKRDLNRSFNQVLVYKNGELYKGFKSQVDCAKFMKLCTSNLSNLITMHQAYQRDGDNYVFKVTKPVTSGHYTKVAVNSKNKKVKAIEPDGTVRVFNSIMDACRHYGYSKYVCTKLLEDHDDAEIGGIHFQYAAQ